MLQIGIEEGLKISPECKMTEKGGFELAFSQGDVKTALEMLEDEEIDPEGGRVLIFAPNVLTFEEKKPRPSVDILKDLKLTHYMFKTFFNLYMSRDEVAKIFPLKSMLAGLNITPENEAMMFSQETVVNKMFANLCTAALKVINTEKLWEKEAFRLKLLRQSPSKPFPTLTRRPEQGVWVELMSVPKEQSKVAFTTYEISKGMNDATIPTDVVNQEDIPEAFTSEGVEALDQAEMSDFS